MPPSTRRYLPLRRGDRIFFPREDSQKTHRRLPPRLRRIKWRYLVTSPGCFLLLFVSGSLRARRRRQSELVPRTTRWTRMIPDGPSIWQWVSSAIPHSLQSCPTSRRPASGKRIRCSSRSAPDTRWPTRCRQREASALRGCRTSSTICGPE